MIGLNPAQWRACLLAQILAFSALIPALPLWITFYGLCCGLWAWSIHYGHARAPNTALRLGLIAASAGLILLGSTPVLGLDGGAALLACASHLKLLELRTVRDARVLLYLGFFMLATAYLFDSSLLVGLYSLLPLLALVTALVSLQMPEGRGLNAALRQAAGLLLHALPILVLTFLVLPRLPPFWSLPQQQRGVTGLSEQMTPGHLIELGRSPELVFRARFEGPPPPLSHLYWRALTLPNFDGQTWSAQPPTDSVATWAGQGPALSYSLVLEPSENRRVPALDVAAAPTGTRQLADFSLMAKDGPGQTLQYTLQSWPQTPMQVQLPADALRLNLRLPPGNPKSREWAMTLKASYPDPAALAAALLQHFHDQDYHYSLKPPALGEQGIDDFLFNTRKGFCAHYAGATTFVLRAAGIPARMVAGYQGGEYNPRGGFLQVRQYDAHAWVEYWQPEQGWTRLDPTYAVAPQRIELGLEAALADEGDFLAQSPLSPLRYRDIAWLTQMRFAWEQMNELWQRWILGYQGEEQRGLLAMLMGNLDLGALLWRTLVIAAVFAAGLSLWILQPWRQRAAPLQRACQRCERALEARIGPRGRSESWRTYARRAAHRLPAQAPAILAFADALDAHYYGPHPNAGRLRNCQRELLKALRRSPRHPRPQP